MAEVGLPNLNQNQADAQGERSAIELSRQVADQHRKRLASRRDQDLIAERILLHADGRGDNMWADIYNGMRVCIPPDVVEFKETEPLLGPILANMVAYHTTMPLRFLAESKNDSESRERAKVDTALVNYISQTQRWNALSAAAMYMSACAGFCPLHQYWRDDIGYDPYEPLYLSQEQVQQEGLVLPRKGVIDSWVGNPFDHTFNEGAKRGSIQAQTYGRVLPAQMIRDRFNIDVEGSTKLPSASVRQRIARLWSYLGDLATHGNAVLTGKGEEELIAVVCREIAAGVDPEWPDGRLTIVALPGTTDTAREGKRGSSGSGSPILLSDQPLPAGRFSSVPVYSAHSFDDVHGNPWAEQIDNLQVQLNLALSKKRLFIEKLLAAPIIAGGTVAEEEQEFGFWNVLNVEGTGGFQPRVMEIPSSVLTALDSKIEGIREAMYRNGGWQAASRGESNAGDPFSKTALLSQQDDTIHGPTNVVFRDTMSEFAQLSWALMKRYGDVPWIIDAVGDEFEDLPEDYIDNTMLAEQPPSYRVTSGYGATPEIKGRQLMQLLQIGVLRPDEFRKQWPDGSLFSDELDPSAVQRKRAKRIANQLRRMAKQFRQETGTQGQDMTAPDVQWAGQTVFMLAEQKFPRLRDDDPSANLAALSEITQDETADAIARVAASLRQNQFYDWLSMAGPGMGMEEETQAGGRSDVKPDVEQDPTTAMAEANATEMSAA